ncbi:hypothetical protein BTUL_0005g01560 [Botrytis tulipae]|uniref:Uncharacterized protein n=1 Tax=Botrytis tulipae TaxID=87230 RepID=A0A4Z1F4P3_9HELO|nr:hypothetical protein BTUL_0005g01560 [Botrytis tulipae]
MVAAQQIPNLSEEHSGPLAPWKIEEQAKRKVTHSARDNVQRPEVLAVSIFSSQYILGYNVENPDEIPKTGRLDVVRDCPPGLNYKSRKHWHHQRNFYVKLAGMQDEWVGFSGGEEGSAEGSKDESQEQGFMGFLNDGVEDVDRAAGHHRLTNDLGIPSPPVVQPVVPLLDRGLSHSRKVRKKSSPPTAIGRASRCAPLKT